MEQSDLLHYVCTALESLGIKYLVTGSQATIVFGEPRFTNDVAIVVALDLTHLDAFVRLFPEQDFYLSREAAREAIVERSMFNIIHPASGLKVAVMIPGSSLDEASRFDRGRSVQVAPDFAATFASPEDVIRKKRECYKIGGSDKHLRDISGVLKISGDKVDRAFVAKLAAQMGVAEIWQTALDRAKNQ